MWVCVCVWGACVYVSGQLGISSPGLLTPPSTRGGVLGPGGRPPKPDLGSALEPHVSIRIGRQSLPSPLVRQAARTGDGELGGAEGEGDEQ